MAKLKLSFPTFRQPPAVTYGRGCLRALAEEVPLDGTLFLVSATATVQRTLREAYEKRGGDWSAAQVWTKPPGEPTWEMLDAAGQFLAAAPCDRLVAVGGGSVLDAARLAWFVSQRRLTIGERGPLLSSGSATRPEFWMVPTTCATGAEGATVAVCSHQGRKWPVVSPELLADRVVLDAQFLEGLSDADLALSLCDTLSHAIESYCSLVPGSLPRQSAVAALALVLSAWPAPPGPSRLERLMEAGYLAGLAAGHLSVGVVHAFAHSAARLGVSHALGNARGLAAGLKANRQAPALAQLAQRTGLASVAELEDRVAPIVQAALAGRQSTQLSEALADDRQRAELRGWMAADPCLRTNPIALGDAELDRFLSGVAQALEAA